MPVIVVAPYINHETHEIHEMTRSERKQGIEHLNSLETMRIGHLQSAPQGTTRGVVSRGDQKSRVVLARCRHAFVVLRCNIVFFEHDFGAQDVYGTRKNTEEHGNQGDCPRHSSSHLGTVGQRPPVPRWEQACRSTSGDGVRVFPCSIIHPAVSRREMVWLRPCRAVGFVVR